MLFCFLKVRHVIDTQFNGRSLSIPHILVDCSNVYVETGFYLALKTLEKIPIASLKNHNNFWETVSSTHTHKKPKQTDSPLNFMSTEKDIWQIFNGFLSPLSHTILFLSTRSMNIQKLTVTQEIGSNFYFLNLILTFWIQVIAWRVACLTTKG